MLAHKANHEGRVAAEVIAGMKVAFDARVIPSVAYTDPEVAWVGVTETEAKARGLAYGKGSFPWAASGRALALNRDEGMTKLLFDDATHRVIGAGIVGPNAGDLISEVGLAIEMGCDAADIGLTVHPHPTLSETVAFAAEASRHADRSLPAEEKVCRQPADWSCGNAGRALRDCRTLPRPAPLREWWLRLRAHRPSPAGDAGGTPQGSTAHQYGTAA
jgi:dihydrolipoamide dehydrogenase